MKYGIITSFFASLLLLMPAQAETLRLATLEWPPFYSEQMDGGGFYTDLTREAYKRAGYDIEVSFLPWKRAIELGRNGDMDGLVGAYFNDDRAKVFAYTDVVATNDEVFVRLSGNDFPFNETADIKGKTVGVLDGSAQAKAMTEQGFDIEPSTDFVINLKKLNGGRFDVVLIGRQFLNHLLNTEDDLAGMKEKIEVLEPAFGSFNIHSIISRKRGDAEEIAAKFDEALASMKADGTYQKILEKHGQQ